MSVFHLDIESFMTAVARVHDANLRNRPLAVAADTARATLLAASPDAKSLGLHKGMPVREVKRHFPDVHLITPDHQLYQRAAAAVIKVAGQFSPIIEPLRYGHIALDMTGMQRMFGTLEDAAAKLCRELQQRLQLTGTVGIAINKLVSQIAAKEIQKHRQPLFRVDMGSESGFLAPLKCAVLPDAAMPRIQRLLFELNLRMVHHIQKIPRDIFSFALGGTGTQLHRHAFGIDPRAVASPEQHAQLSAEHHFATDTNDDRVIQAALFRLLEDLAKQLRVRKQQARGMTLLLRYSDDVTRTRSLRCLSTDQEQHFYRALKQHYARWCDRRCRVSYMRVGLTRLHGYQEQLELFAPTCKAERPVTPTLDRIRSKFGRNAIDFGFSLRARSA